MINASVFDMRGPTQRVISIDWISLYSVGIQKGKPESVLSSTFLTNVGYNVSL